MNPYTRLIERCSVWSVKVRCPKIRAMFTFTNAEHGPGNYSLYEVFQRTAAADQLGFDVRLRVRGKDLITEYVERAPEPPREIR